MTDCSRAVEDLILLIRGKEWKKNKSNEGVPVFGYISASGRDCRNGEMNESHNMGSPKPQSTTGTDHVTTSSKLPNTGGKDKEQVSVLAFRQKKTHLLYFLFLLDFVNSFRDCLYTTCFVWLDASGLLVLSVCSLQL